MTARWSDHTDPGSPTGYVRARIEGHDEWLAAAQASRQARVSALRNSPHSPTGAPGRPRGSVCPPPATCATSRWEPEEAPDCPGPLGGGAGDALAGLGGCLGGGLGLRPLSLASRR